MLNPFQILVSARPAAFVLAACAAIAGCGQKGPLYLPTEPAAAGRLTLPQTLNPVGSTSSPASPGVSPAPGIPASPASAATPGPTQPASAPR